MKKKIVFYYCYCDPLSHNALCQACEVGCLNKKLKHSSNRIFFHNFSPSKAKHHNMSNNKLTLSGVCNVWLCSRGETPLQNCNTTYTNKFGPRNENVVVKSWRKNKWYHLLSTSQNQMAKQWRHVFLSWNNGSITAPCFLSCPSQRSQPQ